MAAAGIGVGVLLALAAGPEIEPLLFGTSARSPVVFAVVTAVLLIAALAASFIPARRATRVDPVLALRS
jgi:ABC-type antimicrobial peptide transport system permease subunit